MERERKELSIRKTANLTDKMREERGGEQLETTSMSMETTTMSKSTDLLTSSTSSSSTSSISSDVSKSTTPIKRIPEAERPVRVQKETTVDFSLSLVSLLERTCDTKSLNSISEVENPDEYEKKCETVNTSIGPKKEKISFVSPYNDPPSQAKYVSEFELVDLMIRPRNFITQCRRIEHQRRFEVEHKFLDEIVADIDKLLAASARMDVEVKVIKTRDRNGSPRAEIRLVRRMKAEKIGEIGGVYGVEGSGDGVKVKKQEQMTRAPIRKPLTLNVVSGVYASFKRKLGF